MPTVEMKLPPLDQMFLVGIWIETLLYGACVSSLMSSRVVFCCRHIVLLAGIK